MRRVVIDSREVEPGDIFIPIKGEHHDGHAFIDEVIRKGGQVLDVDIAQYAKQYRKKLKCPIIGVTGSAGKTTVKDLLASVLGQKYTVVKTLENQNNEIGVPLTVLRADYSTEILIVELAMRHPGEIGQLARIVRPTHTVITSVGMTHVEILKTPRKIALAKAEIFTAPLSAETAPRYAFLNHSSGFYDLLHRKATAKGYTIFPFGGQDKPDQNINLCTTIGHHFGLTDVQIAAGFAQFESSSHRLKVSHLSGSAGAITLVDDTYNANPDGVAYSLQYLRRFNGRKILVLGDMLELGEYSEAAHQGVVDQALDAGVDVIFTYGPASANMKSEDVSIVSFLDKAQLHQVVLDELKAGDVVLVKGSRGMKMEETVEYVSDRYVHV